jgi:O-antigen/teichoic acid export membrane protein
VRFITSLAEQAFGSIVTFAINLWLIRNGASASYGVYVFWLAVAWVLGTAQGTLVITHLFKLPAGPDQAEARREPERLFLTVMIAILAASAIGVAIGDAALRGAGSALSSPAAVLFIPAFMLFQYARAFAFSRQRPVLAACLTGGILASAVLVLVLDKWLGHQPDAGRVLLLTSLAYGLCSLAVLLVLLDGAGPMLRASDIRRHAHLLHGSWWLMLGAASGEITSRLSGFAVVARFGPEALAVLSAVQVVIRPAWMLSAAWTSIGFPQLSARHAKGDTAGFLRTLLGGASIPTAGCIIWTAIVVMCWPFVSHTLYHGRYLAIGPLAYFWGANAALGALAVALNTAMLATGEFRRLALIDLAGALMTILAVAVVVSRFDYPASVIATLIGQSTLIVLMGRALLPRVWPAMAARPEAPPLDSAGDKSPDPIRS